MSRKVIDGKNLPMRSPIFSAIVTFCLLDLYKVGSFWVGVLSLFYAVYSVVWIIDIFNRETKDIFK